MNTGVVLLAGGRSSRMGCSKARLMISGESFLERISKQIEDYDEKIISVDAGSLLQISGFATIQDVYPGCGPIGGLHAALSSCRSEALLAVPCDMPMFRSSLGSYMIQCLAPEHDAVIVRTSDGSLHPFCGVYRKEIADFLQQRIRMNKLSIMRALEMLNTYAVDLSDLMYHDSCIANINSAADYAVLLQQQTIETQKTMIPKDSNA